MSDREVTLTLEQVTRCKTVRATPEGVWRGAAAKGLNQAIEREFTA